MKSYQFEEELANLRPALLQFTRKFTNNRDDSMDLMQDTILKALSQKTKFKEDINLNGWLFVLMRNMFINQYRKDKKSRNMPMEDSYLYQAEEPHTFNRPDAATHLKEMWKVINSIKKEFSKPFKMYVSGYRYLEIAKELNLPVGTVKSRIFQARKEIQSQLIGYR